MRKNLKQGTSLGAVKPLSRRALLGGAAAVGGGVALAGCASGDDDAGDPAEGGNPSADQTAVAAEPPAYVPFAGVEADLPGSADGIPPGVYSYPDPPIDRGGYPLAAGPAFTALMQGNAKNIPDSENPNYQLLAEQFGADFQITYGGFPTYLDKFSVTVASGDLPDMCMIVNVAQLPKLLETEFMDLTGVLSGDGIKDYPGLANIPTPTWKIPTVNGRIWGITKPQPPAGNVITSNSATLAARGIDDPNVKLRDGQDFLDLLDQLTNKDKNEFAMGADPLSWLLDVVKTMVGVPNVWTEEGGTFTHENESEEMKDALRHAAEIIQAGYLHPNSFADPSQNRPWFDTGVTALYVQSFVGWTRATQSDIDWTPGNIELPRWDGEGMAAIRKSPAGYGSFVALKRPTTIVWNSCSASPTS